MKKNFKGILLAGIFFITIFNTLTSATPNNVIDEQLKNNISNIMNDECYKVKFVSQDDSKDTYPCNGCRENSVNNEIFSYNIELDVREIVLYRIFINRNWYYCLRILICNNGDQISPPMWLNIYIDGKFICRVFVPSILPYCCRWVSSPLFRNTITSGYHYVTIEFDPYHLIPNPPPPVTFRIYFPPLPR